jgi:DNA-binding PucR family transcriptional regulator
VGRRGEVWAWFGFRRQVEPAQIEPILSANWPKALPFALGEPAPGPAGWRLTHRQARAAFPIAQRSPASIVHYADVAVLASLVRDELLATSLRQIYLAPLETERDGGDALRETLRAYFAAGRNASATAEALDVSRNTVGNRLRAIEARTGRSVSSYATEFEAALRLREFEDQTRPPEVGAATT